MGCDYCEETFPTDRERLEHVLSEHGDELTSHERDERKRELNRMEDADDNDGLPVRRIGAAAVAAVLLVGAAYGILSTGAVSVSLGGGGASESTSAPVEPGPAGSTHVHAQFSVAVNGSEIDFSQPRYQYRQTQNNKVHFEGGRGGRIHVHATGVTIGYALRSLDMAVNGTCLRVHDDTYCESDGGTVAVTVNGRTIDTPSSYVIRDRDAIRIRYS